MFSKPTNPRSIATQLVLRFTLAAALLLSCGLGVFYWLVVRHAFAEDNAVLADKISAIGVELKQDHGAKVLEQELKNPRPGETAVYWIRVVDTAGRMVAETPGMSDLLPSNIFPTLPGSTSPFQTPKNYRIGGKSFYLVATTIEIDGELHKIQVAQDRSADEQFTRQFGVLAGAVLSLCVLASAFIAITVTKRGLRPLTEMTRSFERVGPAHLSERVPADRWPRELQPLATAFDEMLDRLENSFTRLSQFSADLAHELRTPIANIRGEAEVSLTRARTTDEYREVIGSTVAECERLSGIVDNLLFLARAEAADRQIQRTSFDGRAAVEKIAAYYQTLAEDRHVTIACTGRGEIFADPVLFGRAVSNLVDNALRFTPDGGTIQISIAAHNGHYEISVGDSGSGIAAEHLPRVFDRLYRVDSSRSSQGAGLGLALVKSIVNLHGGSARIESELGRGTIVVLTFPNQTGSELKA